jgi:hypothetical protein
VTAGSAGNHEAGPARTMRTSVLFHESRPQSHLYVHGHFVVVGPRKPMLSRIRRLDVAAFSPVQELKGRSVGSASRPRDRPLDLAFEMHMLTPVNSKQQTCENHRKYGLESHQTNLTASIAQMALMDFRLSCQVTSNRSGLVLASLLVP